MVRLRYEDGTIRVDGDGAEALEALSFVRRDDRSESYRAPAVRYAVLRETCRDRSLPLADEVLDAPAVEGLSTTYELRGYQAEALSAWHDAGDRGVVELPTGSGKTVVGVGAMVDRDASTLVVVPTIDLLEQWERELEAEFDDLRRDRLGVLVGDPVDDGRDRRRLLASGLLASPGLGRLLRLLRFLGLVGRVGAGVGVGVGLDVVSGRRPAVGIGVWLDGFAVLVAHTRTEPFRGNKG